MIKTALGYVGPIALGLAVMAAIWGFALLPQLIASVVGAWLWPAV